ncbi:MAG: tRNA (N(6)-L-threonylcarbamoyladenosine(37)-C(2))-methylthiotransferase MtaB [Chlamydiae bacterium CG10_big_fil_rev_8_21_14_0_10_42_34]|nr:MAG: tRNA (N(6)-L-threonylcarbamoyladenosine(37)-C(2))-methylthiotransferase MtaB [Chlamydiae bacterium CG10_big_fil_rev_8_21_14_0_10_42_34]
MKKFKVVTLGCRTNQYESQGYTDQLRKMGYAPASDGEKADLCIVNTCTVTESADSSSRHQIRSLLKEHPNAKVTVTGCMAESASELLHQMDQRIQIVPNAQKERLIDQIFPEEENLPEFNIEAFDAHTRAFVKVQDGCNSYCTYCIIPYVRGRSRSRQIKEIVKEVEGLVANGYKEVVITGINVGDFDGGGTLADLVRAIDAVEGLKRLRISSIDPDEIDEDLADAVIHGKTTCPSMHIVLQAGSNVVLKRMNRKYTKQIFIDTVERMVRKNPDFTVTTDIIVGFPGETEGDFAETLDLITQVKFAKVHMFPYSPRKRTRAALYPNKIPHDVIRQRKQELLRLAEKTAFELRERFVGRTMQVLLESETKAGYISGHTANFLRVWVPIGDHKQNDLIDVKLVSNEPDGLVGI